MTAFRVGFVLGLIVLVKRQARRRYATTPQPIAANARSTPHARCDPSVAREVRRGRSSPAQIAGCGAEPDRHVCAQKLGADELRRRVVMCRRVGTTTRARYRLTR